MLKAKIEVELPNVDVLRRLGPIEWVRSVFGATIDRRSGEVETTVSAFSLFEGLYEAFERVGVTDAVSFLVDRRAVYVDTEEVTDDLQLVRQAADERGVLKRPFKEMHLVLAAHRSGAHLLFDSRVTSRVVEGEAHLIVEVSGRPEALRVQPGEGAADYAGRVRGLVSDGLTEHRATLRAVADELAQAIRARVPGAKVKVVDARVQVVRPTRRQVGRFGHLPFGDDVVPPAYRPVPSRARAGAYADPYVYYWHDPYWDFTNWVLLDALMHDSHHHHDVSVVDASGAPASLEAGDAGWGFADVSVGDYISVDPSLAAEAASAVSDPHDPARWGTSEEVSSSDGWGGSDTSDGWGGSDTSSSSDSSGSDSSGSSCGSSCSSSSCGGGCGGGD
jgi:hypothetical protein